MHFLRYASTELPCMYVLYYINLLNTQLTKFLVPPPPQMSSYTYSHSITHPPTPLYLLQPTLFILPSQSILITRCLPISPGEGDSTKALENPVHMYVIPTEISFTNNIIHFTLPHLTMTLPHQRVHFSKHARV